MLFGMQMTNAAEMIVCLWFKNIRYNKFKAVWLHFFKWHKHANEEGPKCNSINKRMLISYLIATKHAFVSPCL